MKKFLVNAIHYQVITEMQHIFSPTLFASFAILFWKVISECIPGKTLWEVRSSDHYTILIGESTDEGNHSVVINM